jgi:LysM repeat protein
MALPSQMARSSGMARASFSSSLRSNRGVNWRMLGGAAGAVGLVALVAWMIFGHRSGDGKPTTPGALAGETSAPGRLVGADTSVDHVLMTAAAPDPKATPPMEMNMSAGRGSAGQDALKALPTYPGPGVTTPPPPPAPTPTNSASSSPPQTKHEAASAPAPGSGSPSDVPSAITTAKTKLGAGDPVTARAALDRALKNASATSSDRQSIRDQITAINEELIFSPKVVKGDSLVEIYSVQKGDSLVRIAQKQGLAVDWRFLQRINGMSSPNRLTVGQKLKLVRGPFHAIVNKSDYRLDLYVGPPGEPASWTFVRSFRVGLGEGNGTPTGTFVVKKGSKLVNPPWVNPRTGERFDADNPKNPIGERWIGLEGQGESAPYTGYGIHGTIDPDSIGQQRSMGCVRMAAQDVEVVYEMLTEEVSVVKIQP